jgi:hypothetical protein
MNAFLFIALAFNKQCHSALLHDSSLYAVFFGRKSQKESCIPQEDCALADAERVDISNNSKF